MTLFASRTMGSFPCPNRLIRLSVSAIVAAAMVAALVRYVANGPSQTVVADCSPLTGCGEQEATYSGSHAGPQWPTYSPADRQPSPALRALGGARQIVLEEEHVDADDAQGSQGRVSRAHRPVDMAKADARNGDDR